MKTQRATAERASKWCPLGRISVQDHVQIKSPSGEECYKVAALTTGAYNIVRYRVDGLSREADNVLYESTCIGRKCPLYREGLRPWHWGRCALAAPDDGVWAFLALVLSTAIGAGVLWAILGA